MLAVDNKLLQGEALEQAQARFRMKDANLSNALDAEYDYICKYVDPVMSPAVEQLMLHQPEDSLVFLIQFFQDKVNHKNLVSCKETKSRQAYYAESVKPIITEAMEKMVQTKPHDVRLALLEFYQAKSAL